MKLLNTLNSRENIDQSNEKHSSVFRDVLLFMSYSPVTAKGPEEQEFLGCKNLPVHRCKYNEPQYY